MTARTLILTLGITFTANRVAQLQRAPVLRPMNEIMHDGSGTPRHWYALYTYPRHEKSTADWLGVRQIETFLPIYKVMHRWKNRCTRAVELPLFPRYLFARFSWSERLLVLTSKSVVSIVSAGREPVVMAEKDIEALRIGLPQHRAEPHPYLTVGQRARIRSGVLAGMEGIVLRKKNSLRVVLTFDFIMQSVALEVDGADLDPVRTALGPSGVVPSGSPSSLAVPRA